MSILDAAPPPPPSPDTPPGTAPHPPPPIGTGHPARPGLGWTELLTLGPVWIVVSVLLFVPVALVGDGALPGPVPSLGLGAAGFLVASLIVTALRVRSAAAVGLRRTSWRWIGLGVVAGIVGLVTSVGVVAAYVAISGDTSDLRPDLSAGASGSGVQVALFLVLGAVLVPFAEELFFRGLLFGALRRHGFLVAALVSSVLFGLAHGLSVALVGAALFGALTAVLYERSRSIWPAVAAHVTNNAIALTAAVVFL
ncbi:MAG: hypothetical protein K0S40_2201 [Actinomycetospora sp.]|jgi:membrane protease YdiL (CAAX protease family)|nr:hypothetical protein [Actinomycetospora sp.]